MMAYTPATDDGKPLLSQIELCARRAPAQGPVRTDRANASKPELEFEKIDAESTRQEIEAKSRREAARAYALEIRSQHDGLVAERDFAARKVAKAERELATSTARAEFLSDYIKNAVLSDASTTDHFSEYSRQSFVAAQLKKSWIPSLKAEHEDAVKRLQAFEAEHFQ